MAQLQNLAKLLPGLQVTDKKGMPVFDIGFESLTYAQLSPDDKKKYAFRRQGPFQRIVKKPRYIKHFPELITRYKTGGEASVQEYVDWCNGIAIESNKAAQGVRPKNQKPYHQIRTETAALENELLIAKIELMSSEANG